MLAIHNLGDFVKPREIKPQAAVQRLWDCCSSCSAGEYLGRKLQLQSHKENRLSHPSLFLLLEAAAVLPDSLLPCVSLTVSVAGSDDGGFFLFFLFY